MKEYDNQKGYLTDTCLNAQDVYEAMCNELLDFEIKEDYVIRG